MRKITLFLSLAYLALNSSFVSAESSSLDEILLAQSPETQARYSARHPKETLEFFGIEPGMKVAEALPGGGWYSKILLPYLGVDGQLIGADYPYEIWPLFSWAKPEFIEERGSWTETWPITAQEWQSESSASISAYTLNTFPESLNDTLDAILFIRALHNLARFDSETGLLDTVLESSYKVLRPGGIVGIVQHHAREDRSNEWADGSSGYLKKAFLIARMESAGFEFVAESDINANEFDQAKEGDIVWRLPPSLNTSDENKEAMQAIGESNRMTLKFQKPLL